MLKKGVFIILILLAVFGVLVFYTDGKVPVEERLAYAYIEINGVELKVEIADTPEVRSRGLSGRETLTESTGMLFVFPEAGLYGFWMKEMHFPIDIVWIDREKRVIGSKKGTSPETFPEAFYPPSPVKYVLELNSGDVQKYGIDIGKVLSWSSDF